MPDALYRLTYDATIEDAVDTSWRLANRTRAFRRQFKINVVCVGVAAGIVLRQNPQAGFQIAPGEPISIEVSR